MLSVEPYGMKHYAPLPFLYDSETFSALGRAVWDETQEPAERKRVGAITFSALGRAVWDETIMAQTRWLVCRNLSVLSVEPYGMKPYMELELGCQWQSFSALGRAVWDETLRTPPISV